MINYSSFSDYITTATQLIKKHKKEHVLRDHLSASLPQMFSSDCWWVKQHSLGSEYSVSWFEDGSPKTGSIDVRIGKTAIEYEKDLVKVSLFNEGYHQVKEYCAGLLNKGVESGEVFGVLSDTIRWFAYSVSVKNNPTERMYGPEDIDLVLLQQLDASEDQPTTPGDFEAFLLKYFGRDGNKSLTADNIALDFGVGSAFYRTHIGALSNFIEKRAKERPDYFALIEKMWMQSASAYTAFSGESFRASFANEFYMVSLAKFICQAALEGKASLSGDAKLIAVANGDYFKSQGIVNLVDYDYFGWLSEKSSSEEIIGFLRDIQRALMPFDFRLVDQGDLFGRLISELSTLEKRMLLGQEFTPPWLARKICNHVLDEKGQDAKILDMCCGSGVFLVEALRWFKEAGVSANKLFTATTGFDIDPLAVMLAKVNWVFAMRGFFAAHAGEIFIPIYQCDSLSAALPLSKEAGFEDDMIISIGGRDLAIPSDLLVPETSPLFDYLLNALHTLAESIVVNPSSESTRNNRIQQVLENGFSTFAPTISESGRNSISTFGYKIEDIFEDRCKSNLNGIWPFIIGNCYRPKLLHEAFDAVVSNPPWLAMSKLPNNPYKPKIEMRIEFMGIKPAGSSFLHMELATLFATYSIKNYLGTNGLWAFILPDSVLNGNNHDKFRRLIRSHDSDISLSDIWITPSGTFSNKAVVLFGRKESAVADVLGGLIMESVNSERKTTFEYTDEGARSLIAERSQGGYVLNETPVIDINQGADIFPRTALFHRMKQNENGTWKIEPFVSGGPGWFLIEDKKKDIAVDVVADGISDDFVYFCLTSKLLYPFSVSHPAPMVLPISNGRGRKTAISQEELTVRNNSTRITLERILAESYPGASDSSEIFFQKTNYRNKLVNQDFLPGDWILLSSAGGSNPCAAAFCVPENADKIVCDQTLYWHKCVNEEEAIYYSGLVNSRSLGERILVYQPRGEFGERHIHTLPFRVIEAFDPGNSKHLKVVEMTRKLKDELKFVLNSTGLNANIDPNTKGSLASKRKKVQMIIMSLDIYPLFEAACADALK